MSLLKLPNELILSIAANLVCERDINAAAQINRRLYSLLNVVLYRFSIRRGNNSALRWAAFHGFAPLVYMLLNIGANARATPRNSIHLTALHLAAAEGHLPIVEALVQNGANINAATSTGITPLHEAVSAGFECITRVLLESGADFMKRLPNENGSTVFHIASYFGFTAIVQLLLEKGMGIEVKDKELQTPLHSAVQFDEEEMHWYGNIWTIEFLLEHNAKRNTWDRSGRRPKDFADNHPSTIVRRLFQNENRITISEAILLEHRQQTREESEQLRQHKAQDLAAEGSAKRKARMVREAEEEALLCRERTEGGGRQDQDEREILGNIIRLEKQDAVRQSWTTMRARADEEESRRDAKAAKEQQDFITKEGPESILRQERQAGAQETWAKMRAQAEARSQRLNQTSKTSPCLHPALGWLKCKGKAQCEICTKTCTKQSFRCGDCGVVICLLCKTYKAYSGT